MSDSGPDHTCTVLNRLTDTPCPVHLVGVCGVGMAGVAYLLKSRGFSVSGCDSCVNRLGEWLRAAGVDVCEGHDPAHVTGLSKPEWVIRTPAVKETAPEIQKALKERIPVHCRGEVLPELLRGYTSIAICGTHGKTTTSTFVALMLKLTGGDPSWCIGGDSPCLGGVAGAGQGPIVVEADESDGTLALYVPDVAVVTNIEFDHMEHFENVAAFEDCFRRFVGHARRRVVYCAEDPRASALCRGNPLAVSYGLEGPADLRGMELQLTDASLMFRLDIQGKDGGTFELPVPGRHNALNALAAIATGIELGLSLDAIRGALRRVELPRRRFERIIVSGGVEVISDYAHHPSEIRALVQTALKQSRRRLLAVYQPHRYTRTLALGPGFPSAFEGVDELVLVPVYAASETPLKGATSWDLYGHFCKEGEDTGRRNSQKQPATIVANGLEQAWEYLRRRLLPGDLFLVVGAGDVEKIAVWAKESLSSDNTGCSLLRPAGLNAETLWKEREPLASKTTWKVGGQADVWTEPATTDDLQTIIHWAQRYGTRLTVLGGGSNVLVSDLGVRGVVVRLGAAFQGITEEDDLIRVGSGVPLARLVSWMEAHLLGGYEFLEGIPGTLGGALRMNAGAWGEEIGPHVQEVSGFDRQGRTIRLSASDLCFEYRTCEALTGITIVDALLSKGDLGTHEMIHRRRTEVLEKRAWWTGVRCAGSVFRNPSGAHAGQLIEQAGLKGRQMGGARVFERHANVIVTEEGALASDVRSLIETVRSEVHSQSGIWLETEVVFLE